LGLRGIGKWLTEDGSRPLDPSTNVPNNFYVLFIFV
jgi:hypothetical protein